MNKIYVKLKDTGTIFSDSSQDVSVTGQLPVAVKLTKKVQDFISNGSLIEVEEKDAEKLIAAATADQAKIDKAHATAENTEIKKLKKELADANKALGEAQNNNVILSEQNDGLAAKLEAAEGLQASFTEAQKSAVGLQTSLDELQAKYDKSLPYIKGLKTQIENLKAGKAAGEDLKDPNSEDDKK